MAQLMPLPLAVSCFCKIQIGFTFLVPAHPGSPRQRAVKRACVPAYPGSPGKRAVKWVCVCVVTNGQCKATPSVTYSDVIRNHCPLIGTKLYSLMTQAHVCEQLVQDCYWEWYGHGVKLMIFKSQMQCPNYYNIRHNPERNFYSLVSIFNNDHKMNYHSNTGYYQSH